MNRPSTARCQLLLWFLVYVVVAMLAATLSDVRSAEALPEYALRTEEPCASCHVSPGGGGPLTMRGLLWTARGRPDEVPPLPAVLIAPGVHDAAVLYDIACASCHGTRGEGLSAGPLADVPLNAAKIRAAILRGRVRTGMPSFEGQFSEEQLQILVNYVAGLSSGEIEPPPQSFPLPPVEYGWDEEPLPIIYARVRGN